MHVRARNERRREGQRSGFTLIELLVVIVVFSMVLGFTYEILVTTLEAEHEADEMTQRGRIGPSILAIMRRDLQSAIYERLEKKVFLGVDAGEGEDAEDSIFFLTLAPVPPPPDGMSGEWTGDVASVGYVLKRGDEGATLFRRVQWQLDDDPFEGDGRYFPTFERMRGISIRYFDGVEWQADWNSELRFPEEPDPEAAGTEESGATNGTGGTSGTGTTGGTAGSDAESDAETEEVEEELPLPRAVEITIYTYLADELGLKKDESGNPITEKASIIVALPVTDLLDLDEDDEEEGTGGTGSGTGTGASQ